MLYGYALIKCTFAGRSGSVGRALDSGFLVSFIRCLVLIKHRKTGIIPTLLKNVDWDVKKQNAPFHISSQFDRTLHLLRLKPSFYFTYHRPSCLRPEKRTCRPMNFSNHVDSSLTSSFYFKVP